MRNLVKGRLPTFNERDRVLVKGSFDFIGFNYYTSRYAKAAEINPNVPPVSFSLDSFTELLSNFTSTASPSHMREEKADRCS